MKEATSKVLSDANKILQSWRVYCDNLQAYNEENVQHSEASPESVQMEPIPLRSEVATALKSISTGKALGSDKIPIELLQQGEEKMLDIIHRLMVAACLAF